MFKTMTSRQSSLGLKFQCQDTDDLDCQIISGNMKGEDICTAVQKSPNNHFLQFSIRIDPLVLDILRNHPLRSALTAQAAIPELYVQQAWKTIRSSHIKEQGKRVQVFKLEIDHFTSMLTLEILRLILSLPDATAREGRNTYDDLRSDATVLRGIRDMGYVG
ncbi:hypothetical protein L6452_02294 [Arctium lappa]|uniref:Uncharacterized protein n=1 Tax=Arctium lappa TaxID=4217 RepID=A0ACB9FJX1_ARCLA|nr:hypothetical protein L6452_02294 [Arctium lappa]